MDFRVPHCNIKEMLASGCFCWWSFELSPPSTHTTGVRQMRPHRNLSLIIDGVAVVLVGP